jgi:hypothetical protein
MFEPALLASRLPLNDKAVEYVRSQDFRLKD